MSEEILNKHNILYVPEIEYDKNYDTTGYIDETSQESEEDDIVSAIDRLNETIYSIEQVIPMLPNEIQEIIKVPLEPIKNIIGEADKDVYKPDTFKETLTVEKTDETYEEEGYPDSIFKEEEDPFKITVEKIDKVEVIKKEYNYDLVSIIQDYLDTLNIEITKYLNNILTTLSAVDKSMYLKILDDYKISTSKVSTNYKHLSDTIIRNQIARKMKARYYAKMFNLDKTISHIRACKVGVQQRIRYYEARYGTQTNFNDLLSNRILENNRMLYDKKYKQNFFNLYKYLNSSVIMLKECLSICINEIQAKTILLEKEGEDLW